MNPFIQLLVPGKVMMNKTNKVRILLELRVFSVQQTRIIESHKYTYTLIEFEKGGADEDSGLGFGKMVLKKQV